MAAAAAVTARPKGSATEPELRRERFIAKRLRQGRRVKELARRSFTAPGNIICYQNSVGLFLQFIKIYLDMVFQYVYND